MSEDRYCVLRISEATREKIIEIASKQEFPPSWTTIANSMLLQGIKNYSPESLPSPEKKE